MKWPPSTFSPRCSEKPASSYWVWPKIICWAPVTLVQIFRVSFLVLSKAYLFIANKMEFYNFGKYNKLPPNRHNQEKGHCSFQSLSSPHQCPFPFFEALWAAIGVLESQRAVYEILHGHFFFSRQNIDKQGSFPLPIFPTGMSLATPYFPFRKVAEHGVLYFTLL